LSFPLTSYAVSLMIVSFPVVILSPSITGWLIVWVVFPSLLYNAREIFPSPSVLLPRVTAAISFPSSVKT
ncbi:hypothetical protein AAAU51_13160, partial [Anaerostipes amylophilus]